MNRRIVIICFFAAIMGHVQAEDYSSVAHLAAIPGAGIGISAHATVFWAYNKYLKTPLKHIEDDVLAVNKAIQRLKDRLQKTINENSHKKWESHKFEKERIDLIKKWLNDPAFNNFESWLSGKNWSIMSHKKR